MTNHESQLSVWIIKKQPKRAVAINKPQHDSYRGNIFIASQRYQSARSSKRCPEKEGVTWSWTCDTGVVVAACLSSGRLFAEALNWLMRSAASDPVSSFLWLLTVINLPVLISWVIFWWETMSSAHVSLRLHPRDGSVWHSDHSESFLFGMMESFLIIVFTHLNHWIQFGRVV